MIIASIKNKTINSLANKPDNTKKMTKADAKNSVQDLLNLYSSFINSLNGSPSAVTKAEPIMDEVFDPSLTLITDKGSVDLPWSKDFCKSFAQEGNIAIVTHIKPIHQHHILALLK